LDTPPYGLDQDESIPLNISIVTNPEATSEGWLAYENSRLSGWQSDRCRASAMSQFEYKPFSPMTDGNGLFSN
jgi:hypothetical protein